MAADICVDRGWHQPVGWCYPSPLDGSRRTQKVSLFIGWHLEMTDWQTERLVKWQVFRPGDGILDDIPSPHCSTRRVSHLLCVAGYPAAAIWMLGGNGAGDEEGGL